MRVLHLIPSLGLSGAEKQLSYLGSSLPAAGADCHVAFLQDGMEDRANRERLVSGGASLHRVAGRSPYDPRLLWSIRGLVRRVRPDIVQTWLAMMDVAGGLALRGLQTPWVVSERNTPDLVTRTPKMRVRDRVVPWCDAVAANSRSGQQYWQQRLDPSIPCPVIPNALEVDAIRATPPGDPALLGLPSEGPLVLYVGRLWPHKNIGALLDAMRRIIVASDASALVIGTGSEHASVLNFIREQGLEGRLAAPGFIPDPWTWLRRADIFLSLSRTEGMPNTVMEASACGCPLVLSDILPHRDLLGPERAELVRSSDPEGAAAAALELLQDPKRAIRRAEATRRLAEEWTIGRTVECYLSLYEEVLRSRDITRPVESTCRHAENAGP